MKVNLCIAKASSVRIVPGCGHRSEISCGIMYRQG